MAGFGWSGLRVFRLLFMELKPLCWLLIAYVSFVPLSSGWKGLVVSFWLVLVLSSACWMGPLGVALHFAWFGSGFVCIAGILLFGHPKLVGFTVYWRWLVRESHPFTYSPQVLVRLGFGGILSGWTGLDLGCLCFVT